MTTTIAMGNAPSSGSTFLADLLDSTNFTAVGPELNLFMLSNLYSFGDLYRNLNSTNKVSSIYSISPKLNYRVLHAYGLTEEILLHIIKESKTLSEFLEKFAKYFLSLRSKSTDGIVIEHSPQNIQYVDKYLEYTNNYFIHIVRNPINVYKSLLNRGISDNISLLTWMFEEAKIYKHLENEKVIIVKYENLIKDPYGIVSDIIKNISGKDISKDELEKNYKNNSYRKYFAERHETWTYKKVGQVGKDHKKSFSKIELQKLFSLLDYKIEKNYATHFNLAEVSFVELLKKFDYFEIFQDTVQIQDKIELCLEENELSLIEKRFNQDLKVKEVNSKDLSVYFNPFEKVN